jgi:hypothetical protein
LRSALRTEGYRPADLRVSGHGSPGHEA